MDLMLYFGVVTFETKVFLCVCRFVVNICARMFKMRMFKNGSSLKL